MSQNVEIVQAVIDGWLRGDPATLELISEDVTYVAPPTMPGGGTYHGHEGVLQWVVDWRREWTGYMHTASLWTLLDGKIARWQGFATKEEALEAVGLSE